MHSVYIQKIDKRHTKHLMEVSRYVMIVISQMLSKIAQGNALGMLFFHKATYRIGNLELMGFFNRYRFFEYITYCEN